MEETLRENYSKNIRNSQANRSDFSKVLHQMNETNTNSSENKKETNALHEAADAVFKSGKGSKKRHFKVDSELYGTEEGASKRDAYLHDVKVKNRQEKSKKNQKKRKKVTEVSKCDTEYNEKEKNILFDMKYASAAAAVTCAVTSVVYMFRRNN